MPEQIWAVTPSQPSIILADEQIQSPALQRVVRQTLEAVLYERLVESVEAPGPEAWGTTFYFGINGKGYSCQGRRGGFDRLRLDLGSLRRIGSQSTRLPLQEFLVQLVEALPGDAERKQILLQELQQTLYWCEWNSANLPTQSRHLGTDYVHLETAGHQGHSYHPCFKARTGFSREDHRRYSPEAAQPFQLHWLAVPSAWVVAGVQGDWSSFWLQEFGADLLQILEQRCRPHVGQTDNYVYIPVHPWQWQHRLANRLRSVSPQILHLGTAGDRYLPSQSMRTLFNITHPGKAHLKMPLDIVCTSSRRYLQSHGVDSAPAISAWLAAIVNGDAFFKAHRLLVLQEYAGLRVLEEPLFTGSAAECCQLGLIWRESVAAHLAEGEQAIPMTAIAALDDGGLPLIDPWVKAYGLGKWLAQLCKVVILPVWHLLAKHGIALEVHAQNTLLLHVNGWPERVVVRDFHESLEYVQDFLLQPDRSPNFGAKACYAGAKANQFYWMDSVEALRELHMDTLYVFHLADLAALCERHYGLEEKSFWRLIKTTLMTYRAEEHCPAARLEMLHCDAPTIKVESLLRKKLCANAREYHHLVRNPLFNFAQQEAL